MIARGTVRTRADVARPARRATPADRDHPPRLPAGFVPDDGGPDK
jgi:hypothetical protein